MAGKNRQACWASSLFLGSLELYLLQLGSTPSFSWQVLLESYLTSPLLYSFFFIICWRYHCLLLTASFQLTFRRLSAICSRPFCFGQNLHLNFCIQNKLRWRKHGLSFSFPWIKNCKWSNSLRKKTVLFQFFFLFFFFFFLLLSREALDLQASSTSAQNRITEWSEIHLLF